MSRGATSDKTYVFESMGVWRALATMSVPTVASQVVTIAYNICDTWFIGRSGNPYMIAASSLVLGLYLILVALANLFGTGGGNLMARQLGRGDLVGARKTASFSVAMSAIVALAFSLVCLVLMDPMLKALGASANTLEYARQYALAAVVAGGVPVVLSCAMPQVMRNAGYAREAGLGVALGGLVNIALDPLLMFCVMPDGYQVLAAGVATAIANLVSLAYFVVVYRRVGDESVLVLPKRIERLDADSLRSLFSVGVPAAVTLFLFSGLAIVMNRLAASYDDVTLAAVGIVLKVERLPQNVGLGICLGMVPLVAYNYARGDHARMDGVLKASLVSVVAVGVVSMVGFLAFADAIVAAFLDDPQVVGVGAAFMRARALSFHFMLVGFLMVNYMQATDRGKVSFMLTVVRHLGLSVPAMIAMNAAFGMAGLVWSQTVADVACTAVSCITYRRVRAEIGREQALAA